MSPQEWLIFTLSVIAALVWAVSAAANLLYLRNGYDLPMWKALGLSVLLGPVLLLAGEAHERLPKHRKAE